MWTLCSYHSSYIFKFGIWNTLIASSCYLSAECLLQLPPRYRSLEVRISASASAAKCTRDKLGACVKLGLLLFFSISLSWTLLNHLHFAGYMWINVLRSEILSYCERKFTSRMFDRFSFHGQRYQSTHVYSDEGISMSRHGYLSAEW